MALGLFVFAGGTIVVAQFGAAVTGYGAFLIVLLSSSDIIDHITRNVTRRVGASVQRSPPPTATVEALRGV